MRLGLFTDIHFQGKGLKRIIETGQWIIEEFKRQGVERVVCLGDSLNTREEVLVEAQSAAIDLFRQLAEHWKVEVLLGNHDMNLKHDRKVSSLDPLALHPNIDLYREFGIVTLDHCELLMMPYHEDQSKIVALLANLREKAPQRLANMVGIAHAGINGAMQITRYNTKFKGALGPDAFSALKRTYTGHFHVHQRMDHRVTYIGSPLQFNFGDSGDTRGVMIYDTATDEDHFVRNPYSDSFVYLDASELNTIAGGPDHDAFVDGLKDRFVTLVYTNQVTEEQFKEDMAILEGWGAIQVRKESILEKSITNAAEETKEVQAVNVQTTADLVPYFVDSALDSDTSLDRAKVIEYGQSLIRRVNEQHQDVADTGAIFEGDVAWIHVQGFMGVQDPQLINLDEMADGIWYLEGENGAGKSTILEMIFWCLFGETIRSDMKVDDVINDVWCKNCKVIVGYKNGWAIERFRKAGKGCTGYDGQELSGNGVRCYFNGAYQPEMEKGEPKATQRKINDLLGIDADKFVKTQIMGQNLTTNFITADEKKRRAMIEEMLGMERFDAYLAEVRTQKKDLADQKQQQQSIQQIRATELERMTTQISQAETRIREAEDNQQTQINAAAQSLQDGTLKRRVAVESWQKEKVALEATIVECQKDRDAKKTLAESFQDALDAESKSRTLAQEIRTIDSAINSVSAYGKAIETVKEQATTDKTRLQQAITEAQANVPKLPEGFDAEKNEVLLNHLNELGTWKMQQETQLVIANQGISKREAEINKIRASLDQPESACSMCGQSVGEDAKKHILEHLETHTQELAKLRQEAEEITALVTKATADVADVQAKVVPRETVSSHNYAMNSVKELQSELANIDPLAEGSINTNLNAAERQYETITGTSNGIMTVPQMLEELGQLRSSKALEAQKLIEGSKGRLQEYVNAKQVYEAAITNHSDAAANLRSKQQQHEADLANIDKWLAHYQSEIDRLKSGADVSGLKQDLESLKGDYKRVRQELESAKDRIVDIQGEQAYVMFWDRAFAAKGGMRSYMMRDSVASLNQLVAAFIDHLFSNGMTLTFTEELSMLESYGKRSGGQRKRTDLAALFAIFFLARQRLRYRSPMLGLDEVFDALDTKGILQVRELVNLIAAQLRKVLIITHADITGASMAGSIYARLTEQGTTWEKREI